MRRQPLSVLCSKCYYVDEQDSEKKNLSTKGTSKRQNSITSQRFKAALNGSVNIAKKTEISYGHPTKVH